MTSKVKIDTAINRGSVEMNVLNEPLLSKNVRFKSLFHLLASNQAEFADFKTFRIIFLRNKDISDICFS